MSAPERRQLVGLLTRDPALVLEEGAQVMAQRGAPVPSRPARPRDLVLFQRQRSGARSRWRLVSGGRARIGQTLHVPTAGGDVAVEVTSTGVLRPGRSALNA